MDHFDAQIRPQSLRNHDAAVLLLVIFDDREPGAADRQAAAVQGVDVIRLSCPPFMRMLARRAW